MRRHLLAILSAAICGTALTATADEMKVEYQWATAIDAGNAVMCNVNKIAAAPQGDYYVAGSFASSKSVMWGDTDITPATEMTFNYMRNFALMRIDAEGKCKWSVVPSLANVANNTCHIAATPDGGVAFAAYATFNKNGGNAPTLMELTDTQGTPLRIEYTGTPEGKSPYAGVVIKFSAEGAVEWHSLFTADVYADADKSIYVAQPLTVKCIAADAQGNIYVGGNYSTDIDFGNGIRAPRALNATVANEKASANCDGFIAKFDAQGKAAGVLTNGGTAPYAAKESVDAITIENGTLYCATLATGQEGCDYTLFGIPAEVSATVAEGLVYGEVDCATMQCTRAAGAEAAYTAVTTTGHRLQIQGLQKIGQSLYVCGGLNGALTQNGKEIAASTAKQIQTLTLAIDTETFLATQAYECGAGIGNDYYAFADTHNGILYTYGYAMANNSPCSLRAYDMADGTLKGTHDLFKGGTAYAACFNNGSKQFLCSAYSKSLTSINGTDEATASYSAFHGFLLSFRLPLVDATSGIDNAGTATDASAPVEYFNLQGIRIVNPMPGTLVIRRRGTEVKKVVVRDKL